MILPSSAASPSVWGLTACRCRNMASTISVTSLPTTRAFSSECDSKRQVEVAEDTSLACRDSGWRGADVGALCLSCWHRDSVRYLVIGDSPGRGQAQGLHV